MQNDVFPTFAKSSKSGISHQEIHPSDGDPAQMAAVVREHELMESAHAHEHVPGGRHQHSHCAPRTVTGRQEGTRPLQGTPVSATVKLDGRPCTPKSGDGVSENSQLYWKLCSGPISADVRYLDDRTETQRNGWCIPAPLQPDEGAAGEDHPRLWEPDVSPIVTPRQSNGTVSTYTVSWVSQHDASGPGDVISFSYEVQYEEQNEG